MIVCPISLQAGITGFESPAADYLQLQLIIDELLVRHPSATFLGAASDNSMNGVGIFEGDILICDRSVDAQQGDVIICVINGESVCKIFDKERRLLKSANPAYQPIVISDTEHFLVEANVVCSLRLHRPNALAGLLCSAMEYQHLQSSIHEILIKHANATYFGAACGHSMNDVGIFHGDVLICDRAVDAQQGDVIACNLNGEFVCKIFDKNGRRLLSANSVYKPVEIDNTDIFTVEGTVICSIRLHRSKQLLKLEGW